MFVVTLQAYWRTKLSPNQFAVLREGATEPPGFSELTEGELEWSLQKAATKESLAAKPCSPQLAAGVALDGVPWMVLDGDYTPAARWM